MTRTLPAAALALALAACTTAPADPIQQLQRQAWAAPYQDRPGSLEPDPTGDCKTRALWICERADCVAIITGCRTDRPGYLDDDGMCARATRIKPTRLHMVPVVRTAQGEMVAIDQDRTWPLEAFPWHPQPWQTFPGWPPSPHG